MKEFIVFSLMCSVILVIGLSLSALVSTYGEPDLDTTVETQNVQDVTEPSTPQPKVIKEYDPEYCTVVKLYTHKRKMFVEFDCRVKEVQNIALFSSMQVGAIYKLSSKDYDNGYHVTNYTLIKKAEQHIGPKTIINNKAEHITINK